MRSAATATGDKPGPPVKGAFFLVEDNERAKEGALCEQQQPSLSRVVEEFFWIGSSIIAFSKWRLGYMGKRLAWQRLVHVSVDPLVGCCTGELLQVRQRL